MTSSPILTPTHSTLPSLNTFWLRWTVGVFIGTFILGDVGLRISTNFTLLMGMIGLGMGVGQWFSLKSFLAHAHRWILVTLIASLVAGIATDLQLPVQIAVLLTQSLGIGSGLLTTVTFVTSWLTFALALGCSQWLLLRSYGRHASIWPLTCIVAGGVMVFFVFRLLSGAAIISGVMVGATVYGALTGVVMQWVLRHAVERA